MKQTDFSLQTIRISHKERVTDRFITAQLRKHIENEEGVSLGTLLFVVEILSPWYPNAQIGQSIINTVIREYTRGESGSRIVNFELALRKTNETLAQITQHGETEWIGNLSSIIALVADDHLHLAQTGQAIAYLHRAGKVSEITEGLQTDHDNHPLTTYTNITSGSLELGDEILLSSSELRETLSEDAIEALLRDRQLDFPDRIRELVGALQQRRSKRMNGLCLLLAEPNKPDTEETLSIDQSVNHPLHLIKRGYQRSIVPGLAKLGRGIATQSQRTVTWTKSTLLPTVVHWGASAQKRLNVHSRRFLKASHPVIQKTAAAAVGRWRQIRGTVFPPKDTAEPPKELPTQTQGDESTAGPSLSGQTIYRIHHYREVDKHGFWEDWTPSSLSKTWRAGLTSLKKFSKKIPGLTHLKLTRRQTVLLGLAIVALGILIFSTTRRKNQTDTTLASAEAATILADAETLQRSAEQALIFNQIETAKVQFLLAIDRAEQITSEPETAEAATQILEKSQAIFDELIKADRPTDMRELLAAASPGVTNVGTLAEPDLIVLVTPTGSSVTVHSRNLTESERTITLPTTLATTVPSDRMNDIWYLLSDAQLLAVDTQNNSATTVAHASASWPALKSLASFRTTLYGLEPTANQIFKFDRKEDGSFASAQAYFGAEQARELRSTIDLAIDGAVYTLSQSGGVEKFQKGSRVVDYSLKDVPTPWQSISQPLRIYAAETSPEIVLLENKNDDHPARLLAFRTDTGTFVAQLLLPETWDIKTSDFNPETKIGVVSLTDGSVQTFRWVRDETT